MVEIKKKDSVIDSLKEAQQKSEKSQSKKIKDLDKKLESKILELEFKFNEKVKDSDSRSHSVIVGVLIASVLILLGIAIEVIIFHTREDDSYLKIENKIDKIKEDYFKNQQDIKDVGTELKNLKINNYLR